MSSWLYRIASNCAFDVLRRRQRRDSPTRQPRRRRRSRAEARGARPRSRRPRRRRTARPGDGARADERPRARGLRAAALRGALGEGDRAAARSRHDRGQAERVPRGPQRPARCSRPSQERCHEPLERRRARAAALSGIRGPGRGVPPRELPGVRRSGCACWPRRWRSPKPPSRPSAGRLRRSGVGAAAAALGLAEVPKVVPLPATALAARGRVHGAGRSPGAGVPARPALPRAAAAALGRGPRARAARRGRRAPRALADGAGRARERAGGRGAERQGAARGRRRARDARAGSIARRRLARATRRSRKCSRSSSECCVEVGGRARTRSGRPTSRGCSSASNRGGSCSRYVSSATPGPRAGDGARCRGRLTTS